MKNGNCNLAKDKNIKEAYQIDSKELLIHNLAHSSNFHTCR